MADSNKNPKSKPLSVDAPMFVPKGIPAVTPSLGPSKPTAATPALPQQPMHPVPLHHVQPLHAQHAGGYGGGMGMGTMGGAMGGVSPGLGGGGAAPFLPMGPQHGPAAGFQHQQQQQALHPQTQGQPFMGQQHARQPMLPQQQVAQQPMYTQQQQHPDHGAAYGMGGQYGGGGVGGGGYGAPHHMGAGVSGGYGVGGPQAGGMGHVAHAATYMPPGPQHQLPQQSVMMPVHPAQAPQPGGIGRGRGVGRGRGAHADPHHHQQAVAPPQPRRAHIILCPPLCGGAEFAASAASMIRAVALHAPDGDNDVRMQALSEGLANAGSNDVVLSGYGEAHALELNYVESVLAKHNYALHVVAYLCYTAQDVENNRAGRTLTSHQLTANVVTYEVAQRHETKYHQMLLLTPGPDMLPMFAQRCAEVYTPIQLMPGRGEVKGNDDRWVPVTAYDQYADVMNALQSTLGTRDVLRKPSGVADYAFFSKHIAALPQYHASFVTIGRRGIVCEFNNWLYLLPEHCQYIFRFTSYAAHVFLFNQDVPIKPNLARLVMEVEFLDNVEEDGAAHTLMRDVIVTDYQRVHMRGPAERYARVPAMTPDAKHFLVHKLPPLHAAHEADTVWKRAEQSEVEGQPTRVGVGIRIEPPGPYRLGGTDPHLRYWLDPDRAMVVLRVWASEQGADNVWTFKVLAADAAGNEVPLEAPLPQYVRIPDATVLEHQLNDGHIAEFAVRMVAVPVAAPKGATWASSRHKAMATELELQLELKHLRWDVAVPMRDVEAKETILFCKQPWDRRAFLETCRVLGDPAHPLVL